jgi:hypothetical protein
MLMQMLRGGNGHGHSAPMSERQTDKLARMEVLLCDLQQQSAVQFQRIADLQVQLDRIDRRTSDSTAAPNLSSGRGLLLRANASDQLIRT